MDASPTKGWIFEHREDPRWAEHFQRAFGKRPFVELYDVSKDPHQIHNVANESSYARIQGKMHEQLMAVLRDSLDPRVIEHPVRYEAPPYAGDGKER